MKKVPVTRVSLQMQFAFESIFLLRALSLSVFASRPPLGGIDDGGFAQDGHAALSGNDGEQGLYGVEKLWPLGAADHQLFFCPTSDRALPTAKATARRRAHHSRSTCPGAAGCARSVRGRAAACRRALLPARDDLRFPLFGVEVNIHCRRHRPAAVGSTAHHDSTRRFTHQKSPALPSRQRFRARTSRDKSPL